jgi:5-methylcytosine-specific restriction endonuclease McrA
MAPLTESERVSYNNRRARKAGREATLTLSEWRKTLHDFNGKCAYCLTASYEVLDHFVPLIWEGGTTAENCIPCCSRCNSRKTTYHPYHLLRHEKWKDACNRIQDYLASRKKATG